MLSISEFSEMCHLSPQALRFYHAEGLLPPAEVDERTGYRMYAFEQVEQAMLITLLRDAGMSVRTVRQALDEPDQTLALLDRHHDEVRRQHAARQEAIQAARAVFGAQPTPRVRHVPAATVVSRLVHSTPLGRTAQEWDEAEALIQAAEIELVAAVEAAGGRCAGRPWRSLPLETWRRTAGSSTARGRSSTWPGSGRRCTRTACSAPRRWRSRAPDRAADSIPGWPPSHRSPSA